MDYKALPKDFFTRNSYERKKEVDVFQAIQMNTVYILLAVIGALVFFYVWTINSSSTIAFNLRQYQQDQVKLDLESQNLQIQISELRSLGAANNSSQDLQMIPVSGDEVAFISIKSDSYYAVNK